MRGIIARALLHGDAKLVDDDDDDDDNDDDDHNYCYWADDT